MMANTLATSTIMIEFVSDRFLSTEVDTWITGETGFEGCIEGDPDVFDICITTGFVNEGASWQVAEDAATTSVRSAVKGPDAPSPSEPSVYMRVGVESGSRNGETVKVRLTSVDVAIREPGVVIWPSPEFGKSKPLLRAHVDKSSSYLSA